MPRRHRFQCECARWRHYRGLANIALWRGVVADFTLYRHGKGDSGATGTIPAAVAHRRLARHRGVDDTKRAGEINRQEVRKYRNTKCRAPPGIASAE